MFLELSISEKTLNYKVTKGLVPIQSRFFSLCAGGETRTLTPFDTRF